MVYTILIQKKKVPNTMMIQPKVAKHTLCHLGYNCSLPALSMSLRRISPGKRKINDAAKPPVRLIMYEMTGTNRAKRREKKNHTTLSTRSRMFSLIVEFVLVSFFKDVWEAE